MYERSLRDPAGFWHEQSRLLDWFERPSTTKTLDSSKAPHFYRWFTDGVINTSYNCLDRHMTDTRIPGLSDRWSGVKTDRSDQIALIYDSPVTNQVVKYTYREVFNHVNRVAAAMQARGVKTNDRVLIYVSDIM